MLNSTGAAPPQPALLQYRDAHGIPLLLAWPPDGAAPCAAVLLQHGFQQEKESRLSEMLLLAAAGLLAVAPDAPAHGARWDMQRLAAAHDDFASTLVELIVETGQDLVRVAAWTAAEFGFGRDRLGLLGSSMGGGAVLVATPLIHPAVTVATKADGSLRRGWARRALAGHPAGYRVQAGLRPAAAALAAQFDPLDHGAGFAGTATLLVAGTQDPLVPIASVRAFAAALRPHFAAGPERLRLEEYPGGHSTPPDQKALAREWLLRHLPSAPPRASGPARDVPVTPGAFPS